ncbi:hypothetical protein F0344_04855 [Streptomyces finlayi]|uniref:Uncharacterized protein n=1 Tax=Streptomyces finlayi TaxID=67296 RepID=A0A7G7BFA7_9ACTN|nr:sigma factor [Streptomyces finlayi]QNE74022.1 hypothetical protein F0344_04855 [Streptomyces finlayi]
MLTFATIQRAQNNDLAACTEVIRHSEERVMMLATKAANRMAPHGGAGFANYREEFAQVARVAVWEALSRFTDETVEAFERFSFTSIKTKLLDAVRAERNGGAGADENAVKTFAAMVEAAEGDVYAAMKMCQTLPPAGRRLSPDRADAARLAWPGAVSIDRPLGGSNSSSVMANSTLADFLPAVADEEPDGEIRPKVGHGAALEALRVLKRYCPIGLSRMTPGEFAANLPALVESLEDVVTLPRDPQTRRYVLDAMRVLRSAVSTATEGVLADDLRDVSDDRRAEGAERNHRVNAVLDSMGANQRIVLQHSFGIGGASDFGDGDETDRDGMTEALGMTWVNVKAHRTKGYKAFAKRYVAALKVAGEEIKAAVLEAAAAAKLTNQGRNGTGI